MKKVFFLLAGFIFLTAQAQTVEEVIQKHSAAMGGLDAFNALKSAKMSGTVVVQGMDLPITIQIVNRKGVRSDVEVMGAQVISAYKDGKGWKQNQFAGAPDPTDATEDEIKEMKSQILIGSALMDYKARNIKAELIGQEDVNGVKAYKIITTDPVDNKQTTYYINPTDYSLIKSISERDYMGQSANVETWYSDPKKVNAVTFYMTRVQKIDGEDIQSIKLDTVELDVPVDEKIFDKP